MLQLKTMLRSNLQKINSFRIKIWDLRPDLKLIYVRPQGLLLSINGDEGGGWRRAGIQLDDKKSQSGDKTGDMWSMMWLSSDLGCVSLSVITSHQNAELSVETQ